MDLVAVGKETYKYGNISPGLPTKRPFFLAVDASELGLSAK